MNLTRRHFLKAAAVVIPFAIAGCGGDSSTKGSKTEPAIPKIELKHFQTLNYSYVLLGDFKTNFIHNTTNSNGARFFTIQLIPDFSNPENTAEVGMKVFDSRTNTITESKADYNLFESPDYWLTITGENADKLGINSNSETLLPKGTQIIDDRYYYTDGSQTYIDEKTSIVVP